MKNYFEVKAAYQKIDHASGKTKKVTEAYLIDAITFAEAETRVYEILESVVSGEFAVKSIAKSNIQDAYFYEAGEFWFKCKMVFEDLDEESGKTKKVNNYFLITADTAKEAYIRLKEVHKEMIVPFEIPNIAQSPIVDVFGYNPDNEITQSDYELTQPEVMENKRELVRFHLAGHQDLTYVDASIIGGLNGSVGTITSCNDGGSFEFNALNMENQAVNLEDNAEGCNFEFAYPMKDFEVKILNYIVERIEEITE